MSSSHYSLLRSFQNALSGLLEEPDNPTERNKMSSQQQLDAAEEGTWREDDGTGTTATEATPLLRSEATSRPGSSRSSIPDGPGDPAAAKPSDDSPSQHVSVRRAVAICLSVYLLIFLQGKLVSHDPRDVWF